MIQYKDKYLQVFQSALYKTTSSVIQTAQSIIAVDPNWLPEEIDRIQRYVYSVKRDRHLYIIYTHSDFDHIIGSGAFPDATVIATESLKNRSDKERVMEEVYQFDQAHYLDRSYEPHYPAVDIIVCEDGQTLDVGDASLTFYLAPGHTEDGLFTLVEPHGIFLSGDYLSDVEFPFVYSSLSDYQHTINKVEDILHKHTVRIQVPGHGTTTNEIEEVQERVAFSNLYLEKLKSHDKSLEKVLEEKFPFYDGMRGEHLDNKKLVNHDS
ncbi:MBL fold metallo-hydrolase [Halobacillus salinus]|uniref:MBL fold metallo-hydrolase n=1 Tax=Halobacillus salinus TaxID=192814 RepID=UPI0009A7DB48|nr:MBL fold metallo-hydrolase [Halobacillus salinus]